MKGNETLSLKFKNSTRNKFDVYSAFCLQLLAAQLLCLDLSIFSSLLYAAGAAVQQDYCANLPNSHT